MKKLFSTTRVFCVLLLGIFSGPATAAGFSMISETDWNETAVRRVLHTFAYGGFASDAQIAAWADLPPQTAINEMLSFAPVNQKLSPVVDNSGATGTDLESLQTFWSSDQAGNLVCPDERNRFRRTRVRADGNTVFYNLGLQNTWVAMVNTRGLNPFANNVGFWLANYHMAVNLNDTEPPLIADLYDQALFDLATNQPFHRVLANGASSAAIAREYGHRSNRYNNNTGVFFGNDDFAREFHQLFFRVNGISTDPLFTTGEPDYHENVTIEHTAWLLTGMQLDRDPAQYGVTRPQDQWVAPIVFTNHVDATFRTVNNFNRHHQADLEIYNHTITGITAEDKIYNLAALTIEHPESLDNLPVAIITYFADDNLNAEKISAIKAEWQDLALAGQRDDFLNFLRAYAVSKEFHSIDTFKYRTAFHRNMTRYNLNTLNNVEHYGNSTEPRGTMLLQGADVFKPKHDVFGGQTSLNAANSPDLFKEAYNRTVNFPNRIIKTREACNDTDMNKTQLSVWLKDWGSVIPSDVNGDWTAGAVGEWLWQRFIGDGGKNYTALERAQVTALLATGFDLAYLVDPANPDIVYSSADITSTLAPLVLQNEQALLDLNNATISVRREANHRVGMAVAFISMTPFSFAMQGDLDAAAPPPPPPPANTAPTAMANGPYSGIAGQEVVFISTGSSDPDGDALTYAWDFGDESVVSELENPSHTYAVDGVYTVTLTVDDGNGGSNTAQTTADITAATTPPPTPGPGNSAPTANANGPYSGTAGQPVTFSSAGSFDPDINDTLTYSWDFGDGATSNQANPSHTYATEGTHTVTLTVSDTNRASNTANTMTDIAAAAPPPTPDNLAPTAIVNGPYSGTAGEAAVDFSSARSSDPDGDALSYLWEFGDGSTSTQANPSHSYATAGTYKVTLTVDDGNGGSDTAMTNANIVDEPPPTPVNSAPTADVNGPYSGTAGDAVAFSSTGSSDPDNDPLTFSWDFGDGTVSDLENPSHSYATAGTFNVSLTVDDGNGGSDTSTTTADIVAAPTGQIIELKGSIETVSADYLMINVNNNVNKVWITSSTVVKFEGNTSGQFEIGQKVELKAESNMDGSLKAIKIAVSAETATPPTGNLPPIAMVNGPYAGTVGGKLTFTSTGSSDPDEDPLTYSWDFGDGTTSTVANPSHIYVAAGTFNVRLRVDDDKGGNHTAFTTANIAAPPPTPGNLAPIAIVNGPYTGTAGQKVTFSSFRSYDPEKDPLTFSWDFGDGSGSSRENPSHTYATAATYMVSLTVTDTSGASDMAKTKADITNTPPPAPTGQKIEMKGVITSVSGNQFVLSGITINVTPATTLKFEGDLVALAAGQTVELKGTQNNDGSVTADKVAAK